MPPPPSVRRLRRLLLALVAVLVLALLGLYLVGRAGRRRPEPPERASGAVPEAGLAAVGEGFDYTLEEGGRTRFRIRGKSYKVDLERRVYLQRMGLTLFTDEGETYELEGSEAVFDPASDEATLTGEVTVRGLGVEMTTRRLELVDKGRTLLSQQPVAFLWGHFEAGASGGGTAGGGASGGGTSREAAQAEGGAQRLKGELPERLFVLAGQVWVKSLPGREPPFALRASQLFLDRQRHQVRAEGGVRIAHGDQRLDAERLDLWLGEDERRVEFVRAMEGARGSLPSPGEGRERVTFEAEALSATFEPESAEVRKVELEGTRARRAVLRSVAPGPLMRRFAGGYLVARLVGGQLTRVEVLSGARFAEYDVLAAPGEPPPAPPPDSTPVDLAPVEIPGDPHAAPLRQLRSLRGEALYAGDGTLSEIDLQDEVEYEDSEVTAESDRARFDVGRDEAEFTGAPATVTSPQGTLVAPRLLYTRSSGLLYAEGGTRSEIEEGRSGPLAEGPLAGGEGPLQIEAKEVFLRRSPQAFLYRGEVRAWRGENLLLADEISGEEPDGRLEAKGGVRTLWHPEPEAGGPPPDPIEVTADTMLYRRSERTLVYRGSVRSVQGPRVVTCEVLTLELDADDRLEAMLAEGGVLLEDRGRDQRVEGDRARYEPEREVVVVEGETVRVEGEGGEFVGKRAVYDFATGRFEGRGAVPEGGGEG